MLQVTIVAVGKMKEPHFLAGLGEYQKRLQALCRFCVVEVNEYRLPQNPSEAEIARGMEQEGKEILAKIPPRALVLPLCIEGKLLSSPELAQRLEGYSQQHSHIVFVVGGSCGLAPEVKQAGALRLSMSPMTFPHQMARLMLAEQIYRALTILNHQKYHK